MTKQTRRVLRGWLNLNSADRREFITELNRALKLSSEEEKELVEELQKSDGIKMTVGPLSSSCPCCGK